MTLFLLGVNHRTAALEDREALALLPAEVLQILERLARRGVLRESLVLSTCNRTEFYAVAAEITAAEQEVRDAVMQLRGRDLLAPGPHRYLRSGPAVATPVPPPVTAPTVPAAAIASAPASDSCS